MSCEKVSIIVPVYNSGAYLSPCIESILRQTYENIEILLIDDGSADDSLAICRQYADADVRIRVIPQEHQGVSAARNAGMEVMSGEYFAFVDSDDVLTDDAVDLLLTDIVRHRADMASAVYDTVLPDGRVLNPYEDHACCVYSGTEMLRLSLAGDRQTASAGAKLFRRSVFGGVRFDVGRSINEDGFFLFRCYALQPTVVQHNVSIYHYCVREGSNSRNAFSDKYFDMFYFCEKKKAIIRRDFPELGGELLSMEIRTHLFFLEVLCRGANQRYREAQKSSIQFVRKHYRQFRTPHKHEGRMAWIVSHGLYPLYKMAVRVRYYR